MTGTGMNVITNDNIGSYNVAVNAINKNQKTNVIKLERALSVATSNNEKLNDAISDIQRNIINLKNQVFVNQALIDNWDITGNYVFPTNILD